ncbi:MAG TPA: beta-propeller domain-containing protein [Kofleriaceae bacterium]|nr:beta-propeller domain-containing protein [Kofleriaceae bacterium]
MIARHSPLSAALVAATLTAQLAGCTGSPQPIDVSSTVVPSPREDLVRFQSRSELRDYLAALGRVQRRRSHQPGPSDGADMAAAAPAAEPAAPAKAEAGEEEAADESITNTQEAGVDEGGIVKAHGDHLIVLRRGRLFSVRLSDNRTVPRSVVDVSPPGSNKQTWYDEMLVSDDTIVVVGYSYDASATELGLFDFDARSGQIKYRATHLLRSNDYYSSRNYASRLVGDKLVFYMPYGLPTWGLEQDKSKLELPGVRRFDGADWNTVIEATEIYQPIQKTETPVLHTVVTCDLGGRRDLACKATGVIGPYGRTFYVSQDAVYVWVTEGHSTGLTRAELNQAPGVVYRLPLDGGEPGALRVWGAPVDQFSFKQGGDGSLNVLLRAEGGGDAMWSPEVSAGEVALLRVPVAAFSTRVGTTRRTAYHQLPGPKAGWTMQNRFVGDFVLYGNGSGWGQPESERDDRVFLYPYASGGETAQLELPHGVDRIEVMGDGAVVIGTDGTNLGFTSIALGRRPSIADRFVQTQASQGELRSHGFFFKPNGKTSGVLGLPVRSAARPGHEHLVHGSASVLFLEVDNLHFSRLGGLEARPETPDDQCVVSCVDWYGNARPIFYRGRVFALLGYELVEGRIDRGSMREVGRTDMLARLRPQIAR